jgi:hypothetical protein
MAQWRTLRPRKTEPEPGDLEIRQPMKRMPPDLQALVAAHGGYDKITREAWAEYDTQVAAWQAYIRRGGDWAQQERRRTLAAAPKRPMSLSSVQSATAKRKEA